MNWRRAGWGRCQTFVASHFSFHGPVLNFLIYILELLLSKITITELYFLMLIRFLTYGAQNLDC